MRFCYKKILDLLTESTLAKNERKMSPMTTTRVSRPFTSTSRCCLLSAVVVAVIVLLDAVQLSEAQAYHFSKGWAPGRKRSSSSSVSLPASVTEDESPSDTGASVPSSSSILLDAVRRTLSLRSQQSQQQQQQLLAGARRPPAVMRDEYFADYSSKLQQPSSLVDVCAARTQIYRIVADLIQASQLKLSINQSISDDYMTLTLFGSYSYVKRSVSNSGDFSVMPIINQSFISHQMWSKRFLNTFIIAVDSIR